MKVAVVHRVYGCDCGCCGHVFIIDGKEEAGSPLNFLHPDPGQDHKTWAEQLVKEDDPDAELDWENSNIVTSCQ